MYRLTGFLLLLLLVAGCNTGYQQVDGRWCYVTWDEGHGTRHFSLDIDPETFEILNENYAKDHRKVFFRDKELNADAESFRVLESPEFAKDKNSLFIRSKVIHHIDANSYQLLSSPYGRDKNGVYCGSIPMKVDRPLSFRVTKEKSRMNQGIIKSRFGRKLDHVDLDSIPIFYADGEGTDGVHKYRGPVAID